MNDKACGIHALLLDNLKLESPLIDIDAAMCLLDIANELLPVSLDKLILDLTHEPTPC